MTAATLETSVVETTAADPAASTPVDWKASLPDDIKSDPSLASVKDVASLAKGYVHAQKMVGSKGIIKPGKDAKPEEIAAFYNELGRPEKPDGYKVPTENMPEGVQLDPAMTAAFFKEAHDIGLTDQQAAALVRWQATQVSDGLQARSVATEQSVAQAAASLRKEWGNAFDQNIRLAQSAVKEFGGDELLAVLNESGLANNPVLVKAFAKMGREIAQDEIKGGGHRGSFTMSPSEAAGAIALKQLDKDFMAAYQDKSNPAHAAAVLEMNRLYAAKNPVDAGT